jgi:hypothetical protein
MKPTVEVTPANKGGEELYDQSKATQLCTVIGWDRHHSGVFAGHGK